MYITNVKKKLRKSVVFFFTSLRLGGRAGADKVGVAAARRKRPVARLQRLLDGVRAAQRVRAVELAAPPHLRGRGADRHELRRPVGARVLRNHQVLPVHLGLRVALPHKRIRLRAVRRRGGRCSSSASGRRHAEEERVRVSIGLKYPKEKVFFQDKCPCQQCTEFFFPKKSKDKTIK